MSSLIRSDCRKVIFGNRISPAGWRGRRKRSPSAAASNWVARETERERIESPEWIEIDDVIGRVTCFALGLPFHRRAAPELARYAAVGRGRRAAAISICDRHRSALSRSQASVALLTAGQPLHRGDAGPHRARRTAGFCTSGRKTCWSRTSSRCRAGGRRSTADSSKPRAAKHERT